MILSIADESIQGEFAALTKFERRAFAAADYEVSGRSLAHSGLYPASPGDGVYYAQMMLEEALIGHGFDIGRDCRLAFLDHGLYTTAWVCVPTEGRAINSPVFKAIVENTIGAPEPKLCGHTVKGTAQPMPGGVG